MVLLNSKERRKVVSLLLKIPHVGEIPWRELLLRDLPETLRYTIPYSSTTRTHLDTIISYLNDETWAVPENGQCPLAMVLEQAYSYVETAEYGPQLYDWVVEVGHRAATAQTAPLAADRPPPRSLTACRETINRLHYLLITTSWRQLKHVFKDVARSLQETISTLEDLRVQPEHDRVLIDKIRNELNEALVALYKAGELARARSVRRRAQCFEHIKTCRERLLTAREHFPQ